MPFFLSHLTASGWALVQGLKSSFESGEVADLWPKFMSQIMTQIYDPKYQRIIA